MVANLTPTTFVMKQGTTWPPLATVLSDGAGHTVDLTDVALVLIHVRETATQTVVLNAEAEVVAAAEGPEEFPCIVRYTWTDVQQWATGVYEGEWWVVWNDGNIESFPSDGYFLMQIVAALV